MYFERRSFCTVPNNNSNSNGSAIPSSATINAAIAKSKKDKMEIIDDISDKKDDIVMKELNFKNLRLDKNGNVNYNGKIYTSVMEVLLGYQKDDFGDVGSAGAAAVLSTLNGLFSSKMDMYERKRKEERERKLEELYDVDDDYYDRRRKRRNNNSNVTFYFSFMLLFD